MKFLTELCPKGQVFENKILTVKVKLYQGRNWQYFLQYPFIRVPWTKRGNMLVKLSVLSIKEVT